MELITILYVNDSQLDGLDFLSIVKQIGIFKASLNVLLLFRGCDHEQE